MNLTEIQNQTKNEKVFIDDITLHIKTAGKGFPLILLHGNGEDSDLFQYQINSFSKHYQVIAVDTRGHGKSSRGKKPLNFPTFADDIAGLFHQLSIKEAFIIGFSDGGNTAIYLALQYPELIKAMVLVGSNLFPKAINPSDYAGIRIQSLLMGIVSLFSKQMKNKKEVWDLMLRYPDLGFDQLNTISTPTLVLAGQRDMIKESHTRNIAKAISGARLYLVPDADHFLLFKQADKVQPIIESFLKEVL